MGERWNAPLRFLFGGLTALTAVVGVRGLYGSYSGAVSCAAAHLVCGGVMLVGPLLMRRQHLNLTRGHCLRGTAPYWSGRKWGASLMKGVLQDLNRCPVLGRVATIGSETVGGPRSAAPYGDRSDLMSRIRAVGLRLRAFETTLPAKDCHPLE